MSETKITACPETGERVEVEVERTPLGVIVKGCSRFHTRNGMECSRACAERMDRVDRANVDSRERVVVVLANLRDDAARIATNLAEDLDQDGLTVEVADLASGAAPPLADYDAVVIGACVRFGQHPRAIVNYVRDQRDPLATMPASFYSVGGHGVFDRDGYVRRLTRRTGWRPTASATFANADVIQRPAIREFARQIADEIPAALQPAMS